MYKIKRNKPSSLNVRNTVEGETIETKIERVLTNGEPITDGAPIMYTERKDGVLAETNIRTDRFDVAVEAMDYVSRAKTAKRQEAIEKREKMKVTGTEGTSENGGTGTAGAE